MDNPRSVEIWRLIWIFTPLAILGLWFGMLTAFLLAGAAAYLAWNLYHLFKIEAWLRTRGTQDPPEATGIWGEIYYQLYRWQQRHRKRKRKLASIVGRFQESTAAMPDATAVLNRDLHIEWFNKAAQRLLGLRSGQDRGQRIHNLIRHPRFIAYVTRGDYSLPVEIPSPVSETVRLSVRIIPYGNDQRLLLARDITRLHHLENVRRDFVTNVSHELKTPLTVIRGYLEAFDESDDPAWRQAVQSMEQQTTRMQHIVEDLLLLSRLETVDPHDDEVDIAIDGLLQTIQEDAGHLSADKGHEITLEADPNLRLRGSERELFSAFSNLVFNAVRYTPEGGRIDIRWYRRDGQACLEVRDTGIGIPKQHIPRLTERFYRVDVGRSSATGGTGLGLAIVKHVLARHDAKLVIASEVDGGRTFTCVFPAARVRLAAA